METETHVHAFSVSANVILSFFPFLIAMMSLCRSVLKWPAASQAILYAMNDYFPGPMSKDLAYNLNYWVAAGGPFRWMSVVLLMFTASGVFVPMEVALNKIWDCHGNRGFVKNQAISFGLIFACGSLILLSAILTAAGHEYGTGGVENAFTGFVEKALYKLLAIPISILMLYLIYWLLPNGHVRGSEILPAAIAVGLALEVLKYINLWTWPYFRRKFEAEYGPFDYAATLILWSFFAAMLVLGGAEWAARRARAARSAAIEPAK